MSSLEKIIEAINLPKAIVDKADKFLSILLGSAVRETGELLTDKIRYRRFRNQVLILQKAEDLLSKSGLKAKEVSLKTLVPLIEKGSLEEDPILQGMWATLLANASLSNAESNLHAVCINVLSSISPFEAKILAKAMWLYERMEKYRPRGTPEQRVFPSECSFRTSELYDAVHVTHEDFEFLVENLLRLRMFQAREFVPDKFPEHIQWTSLGLRVLRECTKVLSCKDDA